MRGTHGICFVIDDTHGLGKTCERMVPTPPVTSTRHPNEWLVKTRERMVPTPLVTSTRHPNEWPFLFRHLVQYPPVGLTFQFFQYENEREREGKKSECKLFVCVRERSKCNIQIIHVFVRPESAPEPMLELTPKSTPEPTHEPTPVPTPEPTLEPTPEPTPGLTPEPTPKLTPDPEPTPLSTISPSWRQGQD